jgi:hypothetical protein
MRQEILMSILEPKHALFGSIEQMLAPECLSKLVSQPITSVDCQPINGHSGLAGSKLIYVDTNVGRFVLKQMSMDTDYIMFASDDQLCRSATLWQYGLLDQLRPHMEHKILACCRDDDGWGILMEDLTGHLYYGDQLSPPEQIPVFLDILARFHAKFWNDHRLKDKRLGLCTPAVFLEIFLLPLREKHKNLSMGVIPDWIRGGWEVLGELLDPDTVEQITNILNDPKPLLEALNRYPFTLLHGDCRAANLAYLESPVILDWQQAAYSIVTIDLAWFAESDRGMEIDQLNACYRKCLEVHLGHQLDDRDWQAMLILGYAVNALRTIGFFAFFYRSDENLETKSNDESIVKQQGQHVMDFIRWLEEQ